MNNRLDRHISIICWWLLMVCILRRKITARGLATTMWNNGNFWPGFRQGGYGTSFSLAAMMPYANGFWKAPGYQKKSIWIVSVNTALFQMPNSKMSDIAEKIWQFIRGAFSIVEFEQWIYNTPELETLCSPDLFFELISLDYRDKNAVERMKGSLRVWIRERFRDSFPKINEDREHRIVRINGHEIFGVLTELKCVKCKSSLVPFCPFCNIWTEEHPICSDPRCPYCSVRRPHRPLKWSELCENSGTTIIELPLPSYCATPFAPSLMICASQFTVAPTSSNDSYFKTSTMI